MDELQFEKADYGGGATPCSSCGAVLAGQYWQANQHPVCGNCAEQLRHFVSAPNQAQLLRGALYALGAGVVAAAAYAAIVIATGYDLALISIAVGWLIGRAARKGAGEKGSRALQLIAAVVAYMAICATFLGQVIYEFQKEGKEIGGVFGYLVLFALSLGKPYFEAMEGLRGLIGLAILFFGVQQAWAQTRGATVEISGPYAVEAVQQ